MFHLYLHFSRSQSINQITAESVSDRVLLLEASAREGACASLDRLLFESSVHWMPNEIRMMSYGRRACQLFQDRFRRFHSFEFGDHAEQTSARPAARIIYVEFMFRPNDILIHIARLPSQIRRFGLQRATIYDLHSLFLFTRTLFAFRSTVNMLTSRIGFTESTD